MKKILHTSRKGLYFIGGMVALGLGIIGVFLPVLPTTPFLLLASFCLIRSSKRVDAWLKQTKIYQNHLEQFERERAMTMKTKLWILLPASAMIMIPFIMIDVLLMRVVLGLLVLFKYYYFVFKIKTIAPVYQSERGDDCD